MLTELKGVGGVGINENRCRSGLRSRSPRACSEEAICYKREYRILTVTDLGVLYTHELMHTSVPIKTNRYKPAKIMLTHRIAPAIRTVAEITKEN